MYPDQQLLGRGVERVNMPGTAADRSRPGAPRVSSVHQDNFIRQRHLRHLRDRYDVFDGISYVKCFIANRGRPIPRDTVINRLHESGIHCRRPVRCQALTQRHRLERQR